MSAARPSDRGLSLIELVVAMAIFALVAIMGAQALTGMLRMRDGVMTRSNQAAALAEASSLLRADLSAAVPVLFYPPGTPFAESAVTFRNGTLSLSIGGQPSLMGGAEDFPLTRTTWRIENGTLVRQSWPTLIPASSVQPAPAQPVMEGVEALRLRSYVPETGWVAGLRTPGADVAPGSGDTDEGGATGSSYSSALPPGLEVTLVTRDYGEISIVQSLQ
ncbi:type II secretion system protein GspJ [Primorskyibacter sp. 2E107]|uniref:type II secretion system protein GspJ n=1 Tax=Primorskyibacter sp. 2E107 TaxID=3403458 RepID=UPI003AF85EFC